MCIRDRLSENREETTETIVPDYLPDIARIVDASGCLFLRSREIADGKAQEMCIRDRDHGGQEQHGGVQPFAVRHHRRGARKALRGDDQG